MRSVVLRNNNLERNSEKHLKHVALAGDHAQPETESWRNVACLAYQYGLALVAVGLFVLLPPHFNVKLSTLIPVGLVMVFLIMMERPKKTAAVTVAPLTAILSAAVVVFGDWMIVLAVTAILAIRFRLYKRDKISELISSETFGQIGAAIITSYAALSAWQLFTHLESHTIPVVSPIITLIGIICVGLAWQTVNNVLAYVYYALNGKHVVPSELLRTGVVASIYAYLLVATYNFGGLLATAIFYMVVAQIKVVQDVLGITAQLHKLDRAQSQAQGLIRDLIKFTDNENVEFASEVQNITQMMGRNLGFSKRELEQLSLAAELHEMGKAHLPARIRYASNLNAKELAQRKTYSRWGGLMVRAADALLPEQIADWIEFHGEHFDGSGYPRGLQGEDIPLQSRVIAIARDYVRLLTGYDGMEAVDKEKALALLREGSGTLYDPKLVTLLYELVS